MRIRRKNAEVRLTISPNRGELYMRVEFAVTTLGRMPSVLNASKFGNNMGFVFVRYEWEIHTTLSYAIALR